MSKGLSCASCGVIGPLDQTRKNVVPPTERNPCLFGTGPFRESTGGPLDKYGTPESEIRREKYTHWHWLKMFQSMRTNQYVTNNGEERFCADRRKKNITRVLGACRDSREPIDRGLFFLVWNTVGSDSAQHHPVRRPLCVAHLANEAPVSSSAIVPFRQCDDEAVNEKAGSIETAETGHVIFSPP